MNSRAEANEHQLNTQPGDVEGQRGRSAREANSSLYEIMKLPEPQAFLLLVRPGVCCPSPWAMDAEVLIVSNCAHTQFTRVDKHLNQKTVSKC